MAVLSVLIFSIAAAFGFFLPGYFLSLRLESPSKFASSFLISVLLLFHGIFWLGIFHVSLTFLNVFLLILVVSAGAFALAHGKKQSSALPAKVGPQNRAFAGMVVAAALLMLARSVLSPLPGYDTFFRWNFLAEQMLRYKSFQFYPPLTPADFKIYFYVDAIAPVIQFCYWWLYAGACSSWRALTAVFVVPQYLLLLLLTYQIGETLRGARAGALSAASLIASPLFFWSVYMGQETGLTALSLAATLLFLLKADQKDPVNCMVLAGCSAALGALAREYGGIIIICGAMVAILRRVPTRSVGLFLLTAVLFCAPWYVRNWIVAGNPVYSNSIGSLFAVNPIHIGLLQTFETLQGFGTDPLVKGMQVLKLLLRYSPLQFTLGFIAAVFLYRKFRDLTLCSLVLILIWLYAAGIAAGGYFWSLRVLSPALVTLSLLTGLFLDGVARTQRLEKIFGVLMLLACCQSLFYSAFIPGNLGTIPWKTALWAAFHQDHRHEIRAQEMALRLRALRCRILSDDAYAHAGLFPYGIEVVPVWSPEVRFVFDEKLAPETIRKRLRSLGIRAVLYDPRGTTSLYLSQFLFFAKDIRNWIPYFSDGSEVVYVLPPKGTDIEQSPGLQ